MSNSKAVNIRKNVIFTLLALLSAIFMLIVCDGDSNPGTSPPPALIGAVSIIGTPQVGQTLTADTGALGGSGTISYQWNSGNTPISGANSGTYTIQPADEGATITVTVTRSGNTGSVTSTPTAIVTASVTDPDLTLTGIVRVTGTPQVGQTLTADVGALGGSGAISYQWNRGSTPISGANSSTYTIQPADEGATFTVTVTRADNTGSVTSAPTSPVSGLDHVHQWGAWTVITPESCTAPGEERRYCLSDTTHWENKIIDQLTGPDCEPDDPEPDSLVYGGRAYRTVKIGDLTWMAENLDFETNNSWYQGNNPSNGEIYGQLYSWDDAMSVCPAEWRLPTREDWVALATVAGGATVAGKRLKSLTGWISSGNGTDDFGFSALPGGHRSADGSYYGIGSTGNWWSATEDGGINAWNRRISSGYDIMYDNSNAKSTGFSVRCVRQ